SHFALDTERGCWLPSRLSRQNLIPTSAPQYEPVGRRDTPTRGAPPGGRRISTRPPSGSIRCPAAARTVPCRTAAGPGGPEWRIAGTRHDTHGTVTEEPQHDSLLLAGAQQGAEVRAILPGPSQARPQARGRVARRPHRPGGRAGR